MSEEEMELLAGYERPSWLRCALENSRISPEFRARCEDAGRVALAIAKMRRERSRAQRFVELSLELYIDGIAKLSGADLVTILAWLKVPDLRNLEAETIRGVMRLCKEIGMSLREALAHVRIGFAEAQGFGPFSLVVARRGPGDRGLEFCEAALSEVETSYPTAILQKIHSLEDAIQSIYREAE
jgi:hypothetical protein